MPFEEISPPKKTETRKIQPDEILLTTRNSRRCTQVLFRFGDDAARRLKLHVGRHYKVRWGTDEHAGKLRISEASTGWEFKVPKNTKVAQFLFTRLPDAYRGKHFSSKGVTAEHIDGVLGRSDPFIQITLPSDFFAEPEVEDEQA